MPPAGLIGTSRDRQIAIVGVEENFTPCRVALGFVNPSIETWFSSSMPKRAASRYPCLEGAVVVVVIEPDPRLLVVKSAADLHLAVDRQRDFAGTAGRLDIHLSRLGDRGTSP